MGPTWMHLSSTRRPMAAAAHGSALGVGPIDGHGRHRDPASGATRRLRGSGRGVGVLVAVARGYSAAAALWIGVSANDSAAVSTESSVWTWGPLSLTWSPVHPPAGILLVALSLGLGAIAFTALLTLWFLRESRASLDPSTYPLSPHKVMVATRGVFDGPVTVTVLMPAHNEAAARRDARHRCPRTARLTVSSSSPTTARTRRALRSSVRCRGVFATVGNIEKKAGGLNQALRMLLTGAGPQRRGHGDGRRHRAVHDGFSRLGHPTLHRRPGTDGHRWPVLRRGGARPLGHFQRNEYVRYGRPRPGAADWWSC